MQREQPDDGVNERKLVHEPITHAILKGFYRTYNVLGFGFLEAVYRRALAIELRRQGLEVETERSLRVSYLGEDVGLYRTDLLVESRVMVELKATPVLGPTDQRQLLNCLKAGNCDVGLLLHYGPEPGFHRLVHPRFLTL